jgi:hypothetical protein
VDLQPVFFCEHVCMVPDADFVHKGVKVGDEDLDGIVAETRSGPDLGR